MSETSNERETLFVQWIKAWNKAADGFPGNNVVLRGGELMKQWQDQLRKMLEEVVRSEGFLASMGKSMELGHTVKAHVEGLLEKQLASLRLPSLADLQELHGKLRTLDDRTEALEQQLRELHLKLDRLLAASTTPPTE